MNFAGGDGTRLVVLRKLMESSSRRKKLAAQPADDSLTLIAPSYPQGISSLVIVAINIMQLNIFQTRILPCQRTLSSLN